MKINNIITAPVITEKSTQQAQKNVYAFEVNNNANKDQISVAIEKLYGVEVSSVRTTVRKGKEKRVGRRFTTKQLPDVKIAYVTLKKGTIDLFPQA